LQWANWAGNCQPTAQRDLQSSAPLNWRCDGTASWRHSPTKSCSPTSHPAVISTNCGASLRPGLFPTDALIKAQRQKHVLRLMEIPAAASRRHSIRDRTVRDPRASSQAHRVGPAAGANRNCLDICRNRRIVYELCIEHHRAPNVLRAKTSFERIPCSAADIPCSPQEQGIQA
jgi:hypothetical protein